MKKRRFLGAALCAALLLGLSACAGEPVSPDSSQTEELPNQEAEPMMCGLYSVNFISNRAAFWKACGIETLQLVALGMDHSGNEEDLQSYLNGLKSQVAGAHEMGFKVYVAFMSNFALPEGEQTWYNALFDVLDDEKMQKRLDVLARTVEATIEADGYSIFCGDPGGYVYLTETSEVTNYVYLCRKFIKVIRQYRPDAPINVTPWSIASFQTPYVGPDSRPSGTGRPR